MSSDSEFKKIRQNGDDGNHNDDSDSDSDSDADSAHLLLKEELR